MCFRCWSRARFGPTSTESSSSATFARRTNDWQRTRRSEKSFWTCSSRRRGLLRVAGLAEQSGDEWLGDAVVEALIGADRHALLLDVRLHLGWIRLAVRGVGAAHAAVVAQQAFAEVLRRDFPGVGL